MSGKTIDPQQLLISLGVTPLDPTLPNENDVALTLSRLEAFRAQPEYQALLQEFKDGGMSRDQFMERRSALLVELDNKGLLDV